MSASDRPGPPALATWLMSRLAGVDQRGHRESIIGDLTEQYRRGRSSAWYWRQTVGVVVLSFVAEIREHFLVAGAVAIGSAFLSDIYMYSRAWVLVSRLDRAWYPRLIDSSWSWLAVNPWAYRLQPYSWTSNVAWCAILSTATWLLCRWQPRLRGLLIALVLLPQIFLRMPHLWAGTLDWLREPADPIAFYGVLWFALMTFIAIPFSVLLGGGVRHAAVIRDR